jgi:Fe-S-cluster containining protein
MDDYELQRALARITDARARGDREVAHLRGMVEQLLHILAAKGVLGEGHERLIQRAAEGAARAAKPIVRLRLNVDKYQVPTADIDCAARLPLCRARCCTLSFELSRQDLDEGKVRWELEDPYLIRHESDGYCTHFDRAAGGGCTIYEHRPAACRGYDCRGDSRIWIDFDARIPAPFPDGLKPIP